MPVLIPLATFRERGGVPVSKTREVRRGQLPTSFCYHESRSPYCEEVNLKKQTKEARKQSGGTWVKELIKSDKSEDTLCRSMDVCLMWLEERILGVRGSIAVSAWLLDILTCSATSTPHITAKGGLVNPGQCAVIDRSSPWLVIESTQQFGCCECPRVVFWGVSALNLYYFIGMLVILFFQLHCIFPILHQNGIHSFVLSL